MIVKRKAGKLEKLKNLRLSFSLFRIYTFSISELSNHKNEIYIEKKN